MASATRVMIEIGPKGKKVAAVAPDWPGLERGGKNEDAAIERLLSYLPRYAPVAKLAGMEGAFGAVTNVEVVERYPGTGSTDFWGISFAFSDIDRQEVSSDDLEREITLMQASWAFFDDVRSRVSAELRKGPRGGGRDRDRIVSHTLGVEQDWGKGLGLEAPPDPMLSGGELNSYHDAYCDAIRAFHGDGKMAGKWPLKYLIRHTAYHTLDGAWQMEDGDLTPTEA